MALNLAYSSAIISLAWALSLFKITVNITEEADNDRLSFIRIVLKVWCKIQYLIFNKGVVVKQLEISMAS